MLGLRKESNSQPQRGTQEVRPVTERKQEVRPVTERKQAPKAVFPERKSGGLTEEQKAFRGFSGTNRAFWQENDKDEIPVVGEKPLAAVRPVSVVSPVSAEPANITESVHRPVSTIGLVPVKETESTTVPVNIEEVKNPTGLVNTEEVQKPVMPESMEKQFVDERRPLILSKLEKSVAAKVQLPVGLDSAEIQYADGVQAGTVQDAELYLPVRFVYVNGLAVPFDKLGEVHIPRDAKVEVDFGTSFVLPTGVAVCMSTVPGCEQKFGLKLVSDPVINGKDALFTLVAEFEALDDIAYVSKFKSVVKIRFVKEAA